MESCWKINIFFYMLPNVFKTKYKVLYKHPIEKIKTNYVNKPKHCPPLVKEWFSGVYTFNKNIIKILPSLNKNLYNIFNSYFNLYNNKFYKNTRSKRLRIRRKRPSTNRLLVSKPNLKHTNDKVNIIVYTYNRRKKYYVNKIAKLATLSSCASDKKEREMFVPFIKNLKTKSLKLELRIRERTNILLKEIVSLLKGEKYLSFSKHISKSYITDYVKKQMRKEIISVRHKQSIYFEESKYEKQYLLPLITLVESIYNKKAVFNIVNLKYFYNSGSIFSSSVMAKLRNRKNKPITILTASLNTFKLPPANKLTVYNEMYNREKFIQNLLIKNLVFNDVESPSIENTNNNLLYNGDKLDKSLLKLNKNNFALKSYTPTASLNEIVRSLKYKFTSGIRIEIAGRLTKRNTAERSVYKLRYKGNIKNADSSYKKLPTVLLRGYTKSNLMYNQSKSRLRIGAFGLKTWISSN